MAPPKVDWKVRFWRYVDKTPTCWLWTGRTDKDGYGTLWISDPSRAHYGHPQRAPRLMWILQGGTLAPGDLVLHHCDVPACVRPDHLYIGSHKSNRGDTFARNRAVIHEGQGHASAKLSTADVAAIRKSTASQRTIAASFGISQQHVSAIKNNLTRRNS